MKWTRVFTFVWITALCLLYAAHLLHLRADFSNFSPWMDYSKYTDEGWYGSAAIRHFLSGSWRLPGDFNPGAALRYGRCSKASSFALPASAWSPPACSCS